MNSIALCRPGRDLFTALSPPFLATMTTTSHFSTPGDAHAPHRRAFSPNGCSFSSLYTHLAPCTLSSPPALLLACKSSAAYLPEQRRRRIPTFLSHHEEDDLITALGATPCDTRALVAHRSGFVHVHALPPCSLPPRSFRPFGQSNVVAHIAPHPASRYAAFGAADGSIRVHEIAADVNSTSNFNTHAGFPVTHVMSCGVPITSLSFAPQLDTTLLVAGCGDGSLRIFNLAVKNSPSMNVLRPHVARITSLAFVQNSAVGVAVVSAALDHVLAISPIQHTRKQKPNNKLIAMPGPVVSSSQLPDGRIVLATQGSPYLTVWDPVKGVQDEENTLLLPFVSDSISKRGSGKTLTTNSGEKVNDEDEDEEGDVSIIHLVSSGKGTIIVALSDSTLLRVDSSPRLRFIPQVTCGHLEEIYDLRVLQNKKKLTDSFNMVIASNSPVVWILRNPFPGQWDCAAGLRGHTANVLAVDSVSFAAPDHTQFLATASRDCTVRLWYKSDDESTSGNSTVTKSRPVGWQLISIAEGHTDAVSAVALSPRAIAKPAGCGFFMVTAGADRTLKLFRLDNVRNAAKKADRIGASSNFESNKFGTTASKENEDIANCDIVDSTIDNASNQVPSLSAYWTVLAHDKDVNAVAVSQDCQIIATGSQDRCVKMWRSESGALIHVCRGHKRGVWSIAFSTVDRIVASASGDTTIRIWSVQSGAMLRTLQGHVAGVLRVCFISRGTQLVSSGADGVVKVWTTRSGECDVSLGSDISSESQSESASHSGRVWAVDTSVDGESLVSGGADGRIIRWADQTVIVGEEERKKRETEAKMAQVVDSAARGRKWAVAIAAALKLEMNAKLQQFIADVVLHSQSPDDELVSIVQGVFQLKDNEENEVDKDNNDIEDSVDTDFDIDQFMGLRTKSKGNEKNNKSGWKRIGKLILCCRDWHAAGGARNASIGAFLLNAILTSWTPGELVDGLGSLPERRVVIEGLDAHTKRHLDRVNGLCDRMPILEQVLVAMRGGVDVMEQNGVEKNEDGVNGVVKVRPSVQGAVMRKRKRREDVDCAY